MTETESGKAEGPTADDYALVAKAAVEVEAPDLAYRPPMPRDRSAPIALVGAGGISGAHLDARPEDREEASIAADQNYGAPIVSTVRPALSSRDHACSTSDSRTA